MKLHKLLKAINKQVDTELSKADLKKICADVPMVHVGRRSSDGLCAWIEGHEEKQEANKKRGKTDDDEDSVVGSPKKKPKLPTDTGQSSTATDQGHKGTIHRWHGCSTSHICVLYISICVVIVLRMLSRPCCWQCLCRGWIRRKHGRLTHYNI